MSVPSRLRAAPVTSPAPVARWLRLHRRPLPAPEPHFWKEPLTASQERLLQLTASTFLAKRKLATWQGLRNELGGSSTEAAKVFRSLPGVRRVMVINGVDYGYLWPTEDVAGLIGVPDTVRLAPTMAGWWRTGHQVITDQFLIVLQAAVRKWHDCQPDITESVQVTFTHQDVPDLGDGATSLRPADIYEVLQREPPFWRGRSGNAASWSFCLDDGIERYASVLTIEDYLTVVSDYAQECNRVAQALIPVLPPAVQASPAQPPRWWVRTLQWTGTVVALGGVGKWAEGDVIAFLGWLQHHLLR